MKKKLYLIVFTPSNLGLLGRAIKSRIEASTRSEPFEVEVTHWRDMFDARNRFPLNECIRKLHSFDGAIIVLGASDPPARSAVRRLLDILPGRGGAVAAEQQINPNVLIEIGACMARYGRERVFLLKPQSGGVEIPSYFYNNNVRFETYDDTLAPRPGAFDDNNPVDPGVLPIADAAVADATRNVLVHLSGLGQSAYYSDLPAFGLAHGYFNNFMKPAIDNVENKGAIVYEKDHQETRQATFSSVAFIEVVPERRITDRRPVQSHMSRLRMVDAIINAKDGRPIAFTALPEFREKKTLYIVEVPTNLIASDDAIDKIEALWGGGADPELTYRRLLVQREIDNFFRYLELLSEQAGLGTDKIRRLSVPTIEDLTIGAIRALAV